MDLHTNEVGSMNTAIPCVGEHSWRYDLDHADHERIIGPCLSCSKAVAGCSVCPIRTRCATTQPCPSTIQAGTAWLEFPARGRRHAYECIRCGNPILTRYQKRYCSVSCRKDYQWTYTDALEQEERFRYLITARTKHGSSRPRSAVDPLTW